MQVINEQHPIIVNGNHDMAFNFQWLVFVIKCEKIMFYIFVMFFI